MQDRATGQLVVPVSERDHIQGPFEAPVTIVEYGEYECPFCKAAEPIAAALIDALGDRLRFVFRHFPLRDVHSHAQHAAEAAEAAAAQGDFWTMHRHLFAHQDALADSDLLAYARALGLDAGRLESELAAHVHREHVQEDLMGGLRSGARGTPTFFVDGSKFDGPPDLQDMLAVVRASHPGIDMKETAASIHVPGSSQMAS